MSLFVETGEIDPSKDYFPELVGEGRKYKTNQDAGRALMEGTLTIKQREQELAEVRAALAERVKLEALLTEIKATANTSPNSGSDNQNTNGTNNQQQTTAITPEQKEQLKKELLTELEQKTKTDNNLNLVKDKLVQKFGNNFSSKLKEKASELNMTTDQLDQVAATNPTAFLRLVGAEDVKKQESLFTPPSGMSTGFSMSPTDRTLSYYNQLKKDNPKLYTSREIQNQRYNDSMRLGEKFFDVD